MYNVSLRVPIFFRQNSNNTINSIVNVFKKNNKSHLRVRSDLVLCFSYRKKNKEGNNKEQKPILLEIGSREN